MKKRGLASLTHTQFFFPWQISEDLKERLLEFHRKAGLGFGAYDFLERGDDVIFLECNPGGAWLWLEQSLGLKVSEQVAKCLLGINETKSSWINYVACLKWTFC